LTKEGGNNNTGQKQEHEYREYKKYPNLIECGKKGINKFQG
jgi:hypothetical protein